MGKRGQILADELLISCQRYIRFRETGSPDPVEAGGEGVELGFSLGSFPIAMPKTARAGEREQALENVITSLDAGCLYTGNMIQSMARRALQLAALAPSEGEGGENRVEQLSALLTRKDTELAEARAAIKEAEKIVDELDQSPSGLLAPQVKAWLALPAVQAARNPST